ncbi:hypothetical protein CVT26_004587 [Gymnopilus dilepis]|uniref:Uncharacterized protein n=1 Tax=Gymnopilus dilepis TaxID=231916 RepID=A0A409WC41_9AGAR|nr:hypothetical protein CVT26_004587 [Gymnopilus dilepis]
MAAQSNAELPFEGYIPFEEGKLLPEEIVVKALLAVQAAGYLPAPLPPPEIVVPIPLGNGRFGTTEIRPRNQSGRKKAKIMHRNDGSDIGLPARKPSDRVRGATYQHKAVSVRRHYYEFASPYYRPRYELQGGSHILYLQSHTLTSVAYLMAIFGLMANKKFAFSSQRKVGSDGFTKQQRYLSNPQKYAEVLAKNRERNRVARKKKKELERKSTLRSQDEGSKLATNVQSNRKEVDVSSMDKRLQARFEEFLLRARTQAWYGGTTLQFFEETTLTDWRCLPSHIDEHTKKMQKVIAEGHRLLRVFSRDLKKHRASWDQTLDQLLGLKSMSDRISIAKARLRTDEDRRLLDELDEDLERLEELERQEGIVYWANFAKGEEAPESDSDESVQ